MNHKSFIILLLILIPYFIMAGIKNQYYHDKNISDTLDAVHYSIHLDVSDLPSKTISGFTEILLTSKFDNISEIHLELLLLTIDSVFIDGQQISTYSHSDPLITIPLQEPLNAGDTIIVKIRYHGIPFHESWGGFHWSGQYAFNLGIGFLSNPHNLGKAWFPCIDDFKDRASYDCYITVENDKSAVCGGTLLSVTNNSDSTRTFHWSLEQSIPAYLASVAIGHYDLITDLYNGINFNIPITFYVRPADSIHVNGSFIHLKDILSIFENHFGPYSWPRIGYVSTSLGAMEHATNIAYPYGCINGTLNYEYLFTHEISHMWFGDKVTCASAEDMWLNEGWGTYCELFYQEDLYSYENYIEGINDLLKEVLQYCHTPNGDGQYLALYGIPPEYTYGMTVYKKGALIVHTLRGYLGDDIFFDAVKGFLENYAFNQMSSFDLRDYLTSHIGVDLTDFFNAWVFSPGFPHFSVDSFAVVPNGNNYDITVFVRQKSKGGYPLANSNRLEITFMDSNWQTFTGTMIFSGQQGIQTFQIPFEPVAAYPDLGDRICDATTDDSQIIKNIGEYNFQNTFFKMDVSSIMDSGYVRVTHNWVAPDSLKNSIYGLRLSDYRYWKIDGIFTPGFNSTGIFQYNRNNYLDNTLLINSQDSIVVLYRPDAGNDWQSVDFTKVGIWSIGNLYVPNLQKGEYTLAIWDESVGMKPIHQADKTVLKIYPNPSKGLVNIEFSTSQNGRIIICDDLGKKIDSLSFSYDQHHIRWKAKNISNGTYFIHLENSSKEILATEKILFLK
jgi:aminopeptidase N